jgi:hypothetical protein
VLHSCIYLSLVTWPPRYSRECFLPGTSQDADRVSIHRDGSFKDSSEKSKIKPDPDASKKRPGQPSVPKRQCACDMYVHAVSLQLKLYRCVRAAEKSLDSSHPDASRKLARTGAFAKCWPGHAHHPVVCPLTGDAFKRSVYGMQQLRHSC